MTNPGQSTLIATTAHEGDRPGLHLLANQQHTLSAGFQRSGVGLHSGMLCQTWVLPAQPDSGITFVRTDLPNAPPIPAQLAYVSQTTLSTELMLGEASVRTVEHLLSALTGSGVDNAEIHLDGPEVPLLDGSALGWAEAIAESGLQLQSSPRSTLVCREPVWLYDGDAFIAALPSPTLRFTYGIDFAQPAIGNQWYSWCPDQERYLDAIAPARTFGLAEQIEQLRQHGLIKGGSLDNALVCSAQGWLNPPLRFSNEPVRHKLLDLVGDLSLLGTFPTAHFLAYKASHRLHVQFARQLAQALLNSEDS